MGIKENLAAVQAKARGARIVAVTKGVPVEAMLEAVKAGITDIGENRIQEALLKIPNLKRQTSNLIPQTSHLKFHMIGHLQTNKVKTALELFDVIQSVDSLHLAEEISKRAKKPVEIMIEVNTSGEASKYGVAPEKTLELVQQVFHLPNLKVIGLMTIGPMTKDPGLIRKAFRTLRELKDKAGLPHLSMGMSDDYPLAIEEGSDIIRIGRALFQKEE